MSEIVNIKCDGCGNTWPFPSEGWMPTPVRDGWGIINTYSRHYYLCPVCLKEALGVVKKRKK